MKGNGIDVEEKDKQVEVILRWQAPHNESIKFLCFADDEKPHYIFLLLENDETQIQSLKLLKV